MYGYDEEQAHLQKLWEEIWSDEDVQEQLDECGSSDNYEPSGTKSDSDDIDDSDLQPESKEKRKSVETVLRSNETTSEPGCSSMQNSLVNDNSRFRLQSQNTSIDETITEVLNQFRAESSEENDSAGDDAPVLEWRPVDATKLNIFEFTVKNSGIKPNYYNMYTNKPYAFYKLFITDEIILHIVQQTNVYAEQQVGRKRISQNSKSKKWIPTDAVEMEKFLGIILWMGLLKAPKLRDYCSTNFLFDTNINKIMTRNRFQQLLSMWHFNNNEVATSANLAKELLKRKTYLVGTVRKNRKANCVEIVKEKLKWNEIFSRQNTDGIVMLKWCDKREVLMLTTKHTDKRRSIRKRGIEIVKPKVVTDYNKCKSFIDLSDQLKSYSHCLRRGTKWYRKLAMEVLFGSAVTNVHIVYRGYTNTYFNY